MRILVLLITFSSIYISGCSKKDEINPEPEAYFPKIDRIEGRYLFSQEEHAVQFMLVSGTANFNYIRDKVSRRDGGYLDIAGGTIYVNGIYDTIEYTASGLITLVSKTNIPGLLRVPPSKREIFIENGLITKKVTYADPQPAQSGYNDTIYYFYNPEKMLVKTEQYLQYHYITKEYFYDNDQNLQKIYTIKRSRYGFSYPDMEELFGGYDNKPNPLKGQTLWQDILCRSLSKNNFSTYSYKSGNNYGITKWTYIYTNGNIDFSK